MIPNPGKPRRLGSATGAMPRVDAEPQVQHEPPQPRTLPEFDDDEAGGITGRVPLTSEGEDAAKQADDSTTSAAVS